MKTRARDNPFASERVDELLPFDPEWLGLTWSSLVQRLKELDYCGAVVGPHGSGKTTLLCGLKERLEAQGLQVECFFLNEERKKFSQSYWQRLADAEGKVVFLDGAEQLSWFQWRKFVAKASHCRGLVITQHRSGRLPLWVETETSLQMLQDFVRRLYPDYEERQGNLADLYYQTNGNVREALWNCYDRAAER